MPHGGQPHFSDFLDLISNLPVPGTDEGGLPVAGGIDLAFLDLAEEDLAFQEEAFRQGFGADLLQQLIGMQNNPFSLVPALQAFGAAGGGTLAPAVAFDATGGAGTPSPYGNLVDELLAGLSAFALGQGAGTGGAPAPGAVPGVPPLPPGTPPPPGFENPPADSPLNDPAALLQAVTENTITALKAYDPSTPLDAANVVSQLTQLMDAGFTTIGGVPIEAVLDLVKRAVNDPKSTDPQEVLKMIAKISGGLTNDSTAAPTTGTGAEGETTTTTAGDASGASLNQVLNDFIAGKLSLKGGTAPGEIAVALGAAVDQILHDIPVGQYASIEWLTTLWEARNRAAAGQIDAKTALLLKSVGLTRISELWQQTITGKLSKADLLRILGNPFVSPPVAPGTPYPAAVPTVPGPTGLPESPEGVPIHPDAVAL